MLGNNNHWIGGRRGKLHLKEQKRIKKIKKQLTFSISISSAVSSGSMDTLMVKLLLQVKVSPQQGSRPSSTLPQSFELSRSSWPYTEMKNDPCNILVFTMFSLPNSMELNPHFISVNNGPGYSQPGSIMCASGPCATLPVWLSGKGQVSVLKPSVPGIVSNI